MIIIYYLTILRLKTLSALFKEDLQKAFLKKINFINSKEHGKFFHEGEMFLFCFVSDFNKPSNKRRKGDQKNNNNRKPRNKEVHRGSGRVGKKTGAEG